MDLFFAHARLHRADPLGLGVVGFDLAVKLLDLEVLSFHRLADVLKHLVHLLHLLAHRLHLLLRLRQLWGHVRVVYQLRVNGLGKSFAHLLSARPIHILDEQVAGHGPQVWIALQEPRHGVQRLLPLGHVARAGRHRNVVLADIRVVDLLDRGAGLLVYDLTHRLGLRRVDHCLVCLTVNADDPSNALRVVDPRDHVDELPRCVPNGSRKVVDKMVGAGIALPLSRQNSATRGFVACRAQTAVVLAGCAFNVIRGAHLGLQKSVLRQRRRCALRQRQRTALAIGHVRVDLEVRPVVDVGRLPLLLVALKLPAVADERRFRGQRQHLGLLAYPVVVHPLRVLGVSHQTANVHPAINLKFVANHADDGDVLARPVALLQHLKTVGLAPFDRPNVHIPRFDRHQAHHFGLFRFGRTLHGRDAAVVLVQRLGFVLDVEVLGDPHRVLVDPCVQLPVAHAVGKAGQGCRVGKLPFVIVFSDFLVDEAPLGIRAARVLDRRVHVHAKTVPNTPDPQILLKAVVVAVLGQDAEVPFTKRDLVVAGRVIGHVRIGDVLNVPHDAVENLGNFHVGLVVGGDDLARWPVLPLIVGDLQHMLRQLVDRQAGTSVDCLALDRAAGSQHISRPLPLVVGRGCAETQVVQLVFAGIRIRGDRHCEASPHSGKHVAVVTITLGAAAGYSAGFVDARVLIGHYFTAFCTSAHSAHGTPSRSATCTAPCGSVISRS